MRYKHESKSNSSHAGAHAYRAKDTLPTSEQLELELRRQQKKGRSGRTLRGVIVALVTAAAVAVLIATLFLPVLQIYGTSMTPTLRQGEIVVSVKSGDFERGDVIAYYYNNKILVKRAVAFEGDVVNIDADGTVYVNNIRLDEPYLAEKSLGECDIKLPYQVPSGKIFVLGDHRETSVDSRSSVMGCVSEEQIVGKVRFRVWPFDRVGAVQ
jgi:signal peptidase I